MGQILFLSLLMASEESHELSEVVFAKTPSDLVISFMFLRGGFST